MGVDVLYKLEEAMFGELDGLDGNHGLRAKRNRDAALNREAVEPERNSINEVAHKDTWDAAVYLDQLRVH